MFRLGITRFVLAITAASFVFVPGVSAQDVLPPEDNYEPPKAEYSPYADDYFPNRVYFGDTHLHSSWSTDSGMAGCTAGPDVAYRISSGAAVTSTTGLRVKLIRPLDFVVLADHAENLGLADFIRRSDPILLANKTGKRWHDMVKDGKGYEAFIEWLRADDRDHGLGPALRPGGDRPQTRPDRDRG